MTIFVLKLGGQLVRRPHSRQRSEFEPGQTKGLLWYYLPFPKVNTRKRDCSLNFGGN